MVSEFFRLPEGLRASGVLTSEENLGTMIVCKLPEIISNQLQKYLEQHTVS